MREEAKALWPELEWIGNEELRESTLMTWMRALECSPLRPADLQKIPFTLLVPNCPATFMEHKRCVVHIAKKSAEAMLEFLGRALRIDMDVVVAGAILADVGKLLESKPCVIPSRVCTWPWSAGCPTRYVTSWPPTRRRAIWSSGAPKRGSSTMPTS
jgi:hypothetical protein